MGICIPHSPHLRLHRPPSQSPRLRVAHRMLTERMETEPELASILLGTICTLTMLLVGSILIYGEEIFELIDGE